MKKDTVIAEERSSASYYPTPIKIAIGVVYIFCFIVIIYDLYIWRP